MGFVVVNGRKISGTNRKATRLVDEKPARVAPQAPGPCTRSITVVIPCHNYARFLEECLKSIEDSSLRPSHVIVVDDSSIDAPELIVAKHQRKTDIDLTIHHVQFRSQARTNLFGFAFVATKYVLFLDADDKLSPQYIETSVRMLEADRNAACAFPYLQAFGERSGVMHQTDKAPDIVTHDHIEVRNWCCAGSVFRADTLRQSMALQLPRVKGCGCHDWITIRAVLRSGPWHAVKTNQPLHYRIHSGQMHRGPSFPVYSLQANLAYETVTIVVAFSGRWEAWDQLREWVASQTWPETQTRILILNSTHEFVTLRELGLDHVNAQSVQVERVDVGRPALAEQERRNNPTICRAVDSAVSGLYNLAVRFAFGEWILFVEDDVIPQRLDVIHQFMKSVQPEVAAISGEYQHRYEQRCVAFEPATDGELRMLPLGGTGVHRTGGSGFGCLLARRSVLSRYALSGDDENSPWYDADIGRRVLAGGWQWLLDRDVKCDHLAVAGVSEQTLSTPRADG